MYVLWGNLRSQRKEVKKEKKQRQSERRIHDCLFSAFQIEPVTCGTK